MSSGIGEKNTEDTQKFTKSVCAHCGDSCGEGSVKWRGRYFCCNGCRTVFELLHDHDLTDYYDIENKPGLRPDRSKTHQHTAYLDDEKTRDDLLDFAGESFHRVTFSIPQIHCSACVWLLESLHQLHSGIISSRVEFRRQRISISFHPEKLTLRNLVDLLISIGYAPDIRPSDLGDKPRDKSIRSFYGQLAVAGFCFGNIMLLSFPEYLGLDWLYHNQMGSLLGILKIALALPVFFYAGKGFFVSAYNGLKQKMINMDVPISLGIAILFTRSIYDIIILGQPGYMDSLSGLVFFLLIGRLYQQKTYFRLSTTGDLRSFLPIAVIRKEADGEMSVPLDNINIGDNIIIRNRELIPADSMVVSGQGQIDYSFVTGESALEIVAIGQKAYSGGRQLGQAIELKVIKKPSQSYLMQLWAQVSQAVGEQPQMVTLANRVSQIFTPTVLLIALVAAVYWMIYDPARALPSATAVLIVACPCALALAAPFALGTAMRIMGHRNLYLKNTAVVENMATIDRVVFDKTGTITQSGASEPIFEGIPLTDEERSIIGAVVRQSTHPLSVLLTSYLHVDNPPPINDFEEVVGQGVEAQVNGHHLLIGSRKFAGSENFDDSTVTSVYITIDSRYRGCFKFSNLYRKGLKDVLSRLGRRYSLAVLSGDEDSERRRLIELSDKRAELHFRQSPQDKLSYIHKDVMRGEKVLMVGDGINDAGALAAATVGLTIVESGATFSPESNGVLNADHFRLLPHFLELSRDCLTIIKASFLLSFIYNLIGLALP